MLVAATPALFCWLEAALAMDIVRTDSVSGAPSSVFMSGEIVVGDFERLAAIIKGFTVSPGLPALVLASPGGNIVEADKLADLIHQRGLSVSVPEGAVCASACFLLFAASPRRSAFADALIGVHSASLFGDENLLTLDLTAFMARKAATFGVPPSVLGRMITTSPSDMAWLTSEELRQMNVSVLDIAQPDQVKSLAFPSSERNAPLARKSAKKTVIVLSPNAGPSDTISVRSAPLYRPGDFYSYSGGGQTTLQPRSSEQRGESAPASSGIPPSLSPSVTSNSPPRYRPGD